MKMKLTQIFRQVLGTGLKGSGTGLSCISLLALSAGCADAQFRTGQPAKTGSDQNLPAEASAAPVQTDSDAQTGSVEQAEEQPTAAAQPTSQSETTGDEIAQDQQNFWQNSARDALLDALRKAWSGGGDSGTTSTATTQPPAAPQPVCQNTTNTTTVTKPLDIVFSIDVSTSMGPYINVVKENVVQFATILSQKGIDVQFAALGFVDKPELSIDFTNATSFQSQISLWKPIDAGNLDFQEGGQVNLEYSLLLLKNKARAASTKVVVHVSDAVIFAGTDHNNFSTTELGRSYAAAKSALGSQFQFFDSVPATAGTTGSGLLSTRASFSPRDQMNGFRANAGGLGGKSLAFPFAAATLTQELPSLIESKVETVLVCK